MNCIVLHWKSEGDKIKGNYDRMAQFSWIARVQLPFIKNKITHTTGTFITKVTKKLTFPWSIFYLNIF